MPENGVFTDPAVKGTAYTGEPFQSESGTHIEAPVVKGMYTSTIAGTILHDAP